MKDLEKVKVFIEYGKKCIIPERFAEWRNFCYENSSTQKNIDVLREIYAIMQLLDTTKMPLKEVSKRFEGELYTGEEWEWIQKQIVRFSPKGYEFVSYSENYKGEYLKREIDFIKEENSNFVSQKKKNVRA